MSSGFRELAEVQVSIDKVVYVPTLEAPADRPFRFVYFITIHNRSTETVFIRGRKWVVTDRQGCKIVVEGDGVVGQFPRLAPGEQFSYNSYHVIEVIARPKVHFWESMKPGRPFITRIPRFEMHVPT